MTPQEQDFLDRCAIEAMGASIKKYGLLKPIEGGLSTLDELAKFSHNAAQAMLTERRKRIDSLKAQADNPNEVM